MCRLAAYLGDEINLSRFLLEPEHSLVKQAWAPNEMIDGSLNADGYGLAWLNNDKTICNYKNTLPIWSDSNLEGLGRSLNSQLWLGYVRGATPGQSISTSNTQPFIYENLIFTHNGCFKPFNNNLKVAILEKLSGNICAGINGDTDSVYLFALLRQQLQDQDSIFNAIIDMMSELDTLIDSNVRALLNLVISDASSLYAIRHAINSDCPSLYYLLNDNEVKIASEPLTSTDDWVSFNEHQLISFNTTGIIKSVNL